MRGLCFDTLKEDKDWPQSAITQGDEAAVNAALKQLQMEGYWSRTDVSNGFLKDIRGKN